VYFDNDPYKYIYIYINHAGNQPRKKKFGDIRSSELTDNAIAKKVIGIYIEI
jgi:hypothetical protein